MVILGLRYLLRLWPGKMLPSYIYAPVAVLHGLWVPINCESYLYYQISHRSLRLLVSHADTDSKWNWQYEQQLPQPVIGSFPCFFIPICAEKVNDTLCTVEELLTHSDYFYQRVKRFIMFSLPWLSVDLKGETDKLVDFILAFVLIPKRCLLPAPGFLR